MASSRVWEILQRFGFDRNGAHGLRWGARTMGRGRGDDIEGAYSSVSGTEKGLESVTSSFSSISEVERARVEPLGCYIQYFYDIHRKEEQGPLYVGISAPQGCGKTTLTNTLSQLFSEINLSCAVISLDDVYLTYEEQQHLADKYPENPLLKFRGNAGTHDLELAYQTLDNIASVRDESQSIALPRYDKSQRNGRGDRAPQDTWPVLKGPVDIVLLEGWMLGFHPNSSISHSNERDLEEVNRYLANYHKLHLYPHIWIVFETDNLRSNVYQWREQAEKERRDRGDPAMTEDQIRDFVDRFMPAYERYLPDLLAHGPDRRACEGIVEEDGIPRSYHRAPVLKVSAHFLSPLMCLLQLKVNIDRAIIDASLLFD